MGEVPERIWITIAGYDPGPQFDPCWSIAEPEDHPAAVEYVTAASRDEAVAERDAEIARLRAAGEAALYQLVILNGNYASEGSGYHERGWRIDTSEAIAALKAVLPVPAKENDHG